MSEQRIALFRISRSYKMCGIRCRKRIKSPSASLILLRCIFLTFFVLPLFAILFQSFQSQPTRLFLCQARCCNFYAVATSVLVYDTRTCDWMMLNDEQEHYATFSISSTFPDCVRTHTHSLHTHTNRRAICYIFIHVMIDITHCVVWHHYVDMHTLHVWWHSPHCKRTMSGAQECVYRQYFIVVRNVRTLAFLHLLFWYHKNGITYTLEEKKKTYFENFTVALHYTWL